MSTAKSDRNVSACSTIKSDHHAKAFEMWQKNNKQRRNEYLLGIEGACSNPHYSRPAVHPAGRDHFIVKRTAVWIGMGLSVSKALLCVESLAPAPGGAHVQDSGENAAVGTYHEKEGSRGVYAKSPE